jgi:hypothetical protein
MRQRRVFAISSLLLCAAAAGLTSSGTLLALPHHDAPERAQRTLTFEERVLYQRATEEVCWRHCIRAAGKPSIACLGGDSSNGKNKTGCTKADKWRKP